MLWRLHRFKGVPWVACSGNVGEVDAPSLPDPLLTGSGVLAVLGCPFLPPARGGLFSVIRLRGRDLGRAAWVAGGTWADGVVGGRRARREAMGRQAQSVGDGNNSILGGGLAISVCIGMVEPNTISCNAATSACVKGQEWQCALGLLTSMAQTQLERNTTSYSAAISACAKCGELEFLG